MASGATDTRVVVATSLHWSIASDSIAGPSAWASAVETSLSIGTRGVGRTVVSSKGTLVNVVLFAGIAVARVACATGAGIATRSVHASGIRSTVVSVGIALIDIPASVAADA